MNIFTSNARHIKKICLALEPKVGGKREKIDPVFQTTPGICPDERPESGRLPYPENQISTGRRAD
jgi:hypothetical protein